MAVSQRIVVVRHGEGYHNATRRYTNRDPFLTEEGQDQAKSLRGHSALVDCELLVVSPLSRAINTATLIFGETPQCRAVLSPLACERWSGRCDEGRRKSELFGTFPFLDTWEGFNDLPENWTLTKRDDLHWLQQRVPVLLSWIRAQPERRVVVVGHGAFFQGLIGKYLGNCEVGLVPDIPSFLKQFQSPEASVRHAAAAAICDFGKALVASANQLLPFLSDADEELRAASARALGRVGGAIGNRAEVVMLAGQVSKLLGDSRAHVRSRAVEALGDMAEGASDHTKSVARKLKDKDAEVRQNAAWALGQILRKKRLITEIRWPEEQNGDAGVHVQSSASKRRRVGPAGKSARLCAAEQVVPLLHDPVKSVRAFALEALGYFCEAPVGCAGKVAKLLGNSDAEIRGNAAWVLGQIGAAADPFASKIARLLQDEEANVRYCAVEALGEMGEAAGSCAGEVVALLRDLDDDVRQGAACALGKMGQAGKLFSSSLLGRLDDGCASVRQSAVESIGKVAKDSGSVAGRLAKLIQAELDTDVQVKSLEVLGQIGLAAKPFACVVAKLLHAREAAVRLAAAVALTNMQEASSFEADIAEVLKSPEVRLFAEEQGSKEEKIFCGIIGNSVAHIIG